MSKRNLTLVILFVLLVVGLSIIAFIFLKDKKPIPPPAVLTPKPVVEKPQVFTEVIGKSVQGREITAYTYGSGDTHLTFVGGIHGGYEWNSVMLAYQLMDYLNANPVIIPENISVTIIPSLNPDAVSKVTGKEGRFSIADVSKDEVLLASARFNANSVDLNRNFDCNWQPTSMWRSKEVSAGNSVFSEPESQAIQKFVVEKKPDAFVFWHSQANTVYSSACGGPALPKTVDMMNVYAEAAGYQKAEEFTAYVITGDVGDWLAKIGIPTITAELKTHETIEFEQNLAGVKALFNYFK
jgi:predicted deacylase